MSIQHLSGQVIGQYQLHERLGQGGMGVVYRASQLNLERDVAFKVLPPEASNDSELTQRFIREAKIVARLEHPHIVPIYDYDTKPMANGNPASFITMRLLTGGALSYHLRQQGMLPLQEVVTLTSQLASALDYAHSKGIIHRDIKPSNVMFDEHGTAFLVDFGIAKISDAITELTGAQHTIGTPEYMSPEQWGVDVLTPAADQWALAVLVYEMLSGRLPFEAPDLRPLVKKVLNDAPVSILTRRNDLPDAVWDVLKRALEKEPNDRYPTLKAFAQDLENASRAPITVRHVPDEAPTQPITDLEERSGADSTKKSSLTPRMPEKRDVVPSKRPAWVPILLGAVVVAFFLGIFGAYFYTTFSSIAPEQQTQTAVALLMTQTAEITPDVTEPVTPETPTPVTPVTPTPVTPTLSPTPQPDTPQPTPTPVTPTIAPTIARRPTSTPTATFVPNLTPAHLETVLVSFNDGFNSPDFTNQTWSVFGQRPTTENGFLNFDFATQWRDGLARPAFVENDGLLMLFQYLGGQLDFNFSHGSYQTPDYRRWGLIADNDIWSAYSLREDFAYSISHRTARLEQNQWYYALFRIDEDGIFNTRIWNRDDLSSYVLSVNTIQTVDGWENETWEFHITGNSTQLVIDFYQELRFPADYDIPNLPPQ